MGVVGQAVTSKSGNTVKVRRGKTVTTVRVARDLAVASGDNVYMESVNGTYLVVARTDLAASSPRRVEEDDEPDAKPSTVYGYTIVVPVTTRTYLNGRWRFDTTDMWQGSFSGGNNTGVAFYGDQMKQFKGSTILKATLDVTRVPGGSVTSQTATMWSVTEKTRPSGSPTLSGSFTGPSLAVGDTNPDFAVPLSVITDMANGTYGGLAVYDADGSPTMRFAGMGTYSPAFTLSIGWMRTES